MIAAWMLYSIMTGWLVGAAAVAAERMCVALRKPVRFVWGAALAATVVLSALGLVRSTANAGAAGALPAKIAAASADATDVGVSVASGWLWSARAVLSSGRDRLYGAVARGSGDGRVLAMAWAAASLALITLFTLAMLRFRRARRSWREELVGDVRVFVARDSGPALVGFRRPVIVVPRWLLNAPEYDQRLVVQHEQEHRAANDHLLLAAACAALCLLPWNPAMWWMARRVRLGVELDCDARVLRRGVGAADYGTLLLNVASRAPGLPLAVPALADTRSHLERRIIAMTRSHDRHTRRAVVAGLATLLLGLAACSADMPTAAEIDQMDVAAVETHTRLNGQLAENDGELVFIVDGVETPAEEARAIAPEKIASIEIAKGAAARAFGERATAGVVHVRTKELSGVQSADDTPARGRMRGNATVAPGGRLEIRPADAAGPGKDPLIIIDGAVAAADFKLSSIESSTIERVEVIKGPAALKVYGERGANGVIHITLKK